MTFQQLIQNAPLLLAYAICIACLVQLFFIFFIERKDIRVGLKGADKMWQFLELSGIAWLVLFPTTVICSIIITMAGLDVQIDMGVWTTLDAVYFINVGGKGYYKSLDRRSNENKNEAS